MVRKILTWIQSSFGYLWLIALAVYFSVSAGQAMYRNYQAQQEVDKLAQQLESAQLERERLEALVVYYKTDAFREKELRRSLLLKLPEEKVYALPESAASRRVEAEEAVRRQEEDVRTDQPTWQQWIDYLRNS
jgi:cell division protein FtsB